MFLEFGIAIKASLWKKLSEQSTDFLEFMPDVAEEIENEAFLFICSYVKTSEHEQEFIKLCNELMGHEEDFLLGGFGRRLKPCSYML